MFTPKQVPYRMRDSSLLEQSRCRTTTFGLRSISYIGAKLWNDLPSYFKETTCLSDFKMILQTWTGPDLNYPFRSYVWAPSDSLYKSEILFVSYIESRFYTPPLYVHCITALCRSFYACRLQPLTHRYPRLMAGTLYFFVLHWSAGVAGMGFPVVTWDVEGKLQRPPLATGAVAPMTFPLLCNYLFALYIFAPIVVY